jgi:glycosyl transferase family 1
VPLSGGALLEQDSIDSAYFLTPGEHYEPFATIDDLSAQLDRLLGDPARCARLAAAGRAWVTRHFTGDYFWAGLIRRL